MPGPDDFIAKRARQLQKEGKHRLPDSESNQYLELTTRVRNLLDDKELKTVGHICKQSATSLKALGFSKQAIKIIKEALAIAGRELARD